MQILACLHHEFPDCIVLQGLKVAQTPGAKTFFAEWPELRKTTEKALEQDCEIASTFREATTQAAFLSISARQCDFEDTMRQQSARLDVIARRTAPFSPSRTHQPAATSINSSPLSPFTHPPFSPPAFPAFSPLLCPPNPNSVQAPVFAGSQTFHVLPLSTIHSPFNLISTTTSCIPTSFRCESAHASSIPCF